MRYQLRIKPFVSAGEVFLHGDGKTFEILPLSVFPSGDSTIIRIGRSTYWFQQDGTYDGPEFCAVGMEERESLALSAALGTCKDNRGRAPDTAYFSEGSPGYRRETALWPTKPELRGAVAVEAPSPPMLFTRCCDCGWMLPRVVKAENPDVKVEIECPRCGKHWGGAKVVEPS